ncbi:hypothetical protein QNN03_05045 [Streptomyces sp. GXMU-J15]|uniref:Uncharacterized protein n=1 Tax=Streptomyces fuscus TaxID=3048495 RepID=A0ABT7IT95_9ACTN|nr:MULTISPECIES: hypothetical protein [Streptomyces]MDL2075799.1 hypothetical protein [Streptomyces fuscus]SBT93328.1 hypothetical protein GA0115233_10626 [Streptomyces sp. DI166]
MKTCHRFASIKAEFERDVSFLHGHAERHRGSASAKTSAKNAVSVKRNMARALSTHLDRCRECG